MDAWRVFPRTFMVAYGWLCWQIFLWFKAIPAPTLEQAGFAGAVIGLAVPLCRWYFQTGRKWAATNSGDSV